MKKPDKDLMLKVMNEIEQRFNVRAYPLYQPFDDEWMIAITDRDLFWREEFDKFAAENGARNGGLAAPGFVTAELSYLRENYRKYGRGFFQIVNSNKVTTPWTAISSLTISRHCRELCWLSMLHPMGLNSIQGSR
ncbi:MAG: hypothetical protein HS115_00010 [Spirochaetales bacterium]|nr:hypothetical protein [Spirochaetales bacterium]